MVAIENQLEWTDHNHLGQLLTYAANHDVRRLIWVSPNFLPEHHAALEWLNQWTDDEIEIYGVEVTVVRIGDSSCAPVFNKIASPKSGLTALNLLQIVQQHERSSTAASIGY